jgi:hypothetical protein
MQKDIENIEERGACRLEDQEKRLAKRKTFYKKGGEEKMRRYLILLIAFTFMNTPLAWGNPPGLTDDEMEGIYAKGVEISGGSYLGVFDNVIASDGAISLANAADSAVANDNSASVANATDSAVQVGVNNRENGQNQMDTAGSTVHGGDSMVINEDGDNRDQNNLNKSIQVNDSGQSNNRGINANLAQGIFVQPVNSVTMAHTTMSSDITQHNTVTIMTVNY